MFNDRGAVFKSNFGFMALAAVRNERGDCRRVFTVRREDSGTLHKMLRSVTMWSAIEGLI